MKNSTVATIAGALYLFALAVAFTGQVANAADIAAFIKDYQTLIAGAFALVSLFYLAQQIRLQREQQAIALGLATRGEDDALHVVWGYVASEQPIIEHDGSVVGVMDMYGPNGSALEFVRKSTLPAIADRLAVLAKAVDDFNATVYAPEMNFEAATIARLRSRVRMIDQVRARLRVEVQERRRRIKEIGRIA